MRLCSSSGSELSVLSDASVVSPEHDIASMIVEELQKFTYLCSSSSRAFVVLRARGVFVSVKGTSFFTGEGLMRL